MEDARGRLVLSPKSIHLFSLSLSLFRRLFDLRERDRAAFKEEKKGREVNYFSNVPLTVPLGQVGRLGRLVRDSRLLDRLLHRRRLLRRDRLLGSLK